MTAIFAGVNHAERPLPISAETKLSLADAKARLAAIETKLAPFIDPDTSKLRPAVVATKNDEHFSPIQAKFIRFTVTATNTNIEPCIDELEIFTPAAPAVGGVLPPSRSRH